MGQAHARWREESWVSARCHLAHSGHDAPRGLCGHRGDSDQVANQHVAQGQALQGAGQVGERELQLGRGEHVSRAIYEGAGLVD